MEPKHGAAIRLISKPQHFGGWFASAQYVSAMSAGERNSPSGFVGIQPWVRGWSTRPSMMTWKTWMPLGAMSRARDCASARIAKLPGAFAGVEGMPRQEAVAPVTPMTPRPRSIMPGVTALAKAKSAEGPVAMARSNSSCVVSANDLKGPALVFTIRTSIGPSSAVIASMAAFSWSSLLTSHWKPLVPGISFSSLSRFSLRRANMPTA
mmetsp:Transcript_20932/g.43456  ORF Transcript_20932/g.43456 Transcript_20932/m.43456 type:complete len:208 (+) Transcript_20932:113-736(+)